MRDSEFIWRIQDRIAELAVSASAVRNQGAPGVTKVARQFLKTINLRKFCTTSREKFQSELNRATLSFKKKLPRRARNWGTARKILNLFLRDILYNRYLCEYFKFNRIEPWLEVPLDSYVANGIKGAIRDNCVPKWVNIKDLTASKSNQFQNAANWIARQKRVARVHLDLWYWRKR